MATHARIDALMQQELTERASDQMKEAADTWRQQLMGFFFPENEDTVDLCALAVLDAAIKEDGTAVEPGVRKNVRDLVSTGTVTDKAIRIIFLATAQPVPE